MNQHYMRQLSRVLSRLAFIYLVVCSFSFFQSRAIAGPSRWKQYTNQRWKFCVDVPSDWHLDRGFNDAGVFTYPSQQANGTKRSGIEVGARVNQPSSKTGHGMQTLDEIFTGRPDVLGGVQNLELVEEKRITFQNSSAIYARMNYQLNGERWVAENISFLTSQGLVYLLEMRCGRKDFERFDKIFRRMAFQTFRLRCK